MKIISILFLIIGLLSLTYYVIVIDYAGVQASFAWFWLALGILCVIIFIAFCLMIRHRIIFSKLVKTILILCFVIGFGVFAFIEGTIILYANKKSDKELDYLIVLGAQVKGTRVSRTLKYRLDTAFHYLEENPNTKVIVSGGQGSGEDISEAQAMKEYLVGKGIQEKRILMEDRSTNTNENIRYSRNLIKETDARVGIVTNGFHVFRASRIAKKQGLEEVHPISAPSGPVIHIHYYVREVFAVVKDTLVGNM